LRKAAAKQKAIEVFKKSQPKRGKKSSLQAPKRIVFADHRLSDSEESGSEH
jgi:hypothetical protein